MANAMPSLALRCLGPPAVLVGGREARSDVLWRKHVALLGYLALSPGYSRTRAHLIGLLWAERPEEKARRSLNEAVRLLRAALGTERLLTIGETLQLNALDLDVDVLWFESLCGDARLDALELLRGDFLEGFHVDDAPAFDTWMESQRTRIRDAATRLVVARAEEQLAVNRYVEARALAGRALVLNAYSELALSLNMRSAALEGDAAGALASYHGFVAILERDLGERPSEALSGLAERIRAGKWHRRGDRKVTAEPLVGRRDGHAQIFGKLERLSRDGATCLVITGDPGSGRTRLLDACHERLALAGATIATARILETDHDAPWSTLRSLMRGGLLEAAGVPATDHVGMRVLASLVPELAARVEPLGAPDVAQVADAFASLLGAVAEQHPVGLLIDDAQWADGATLAVLRAVWSRAREAPLVLVLTIETGADLSAESRALVGAVGREIPGTHVPLEPLTGEETVALTAALAPWCSAPVERDRLARRVAHESGGNPFLAVTLLRDLDQAAAPPHNEARPEWPRPGATYDSTLPILISEPVRAAIVARVAKLDEDSTAVLRAASVAGEELHAALLGEVSGLPGARVDAALDRLERERFVGFDGERYAFSGRLLPAVIESECMQAGGRHRLRERYIAALAARDDIDSRLLRARLLEAERRPEAFEAAVAVTEQALALRAQRIAGIAIRLAERAARADPARLAQLEPLRHPRQ